MVFGDILNIADTVNARRGGVNETTYTPLSLLVRTRGPKAS